MRYCLLVLGLVSLQLVGCNQNVKPRPSGDSSRIEEDDQRPASIASAPRADSGAGQSGASADMGPTVRFDGISMTAPEGWTRKAPRSSFILAEFALRKSDGDSEDGRLTVSTAGGSIEANIDRWKGQFSGAVENPKEEQLDTAVGKVTYVDLSGDFNDQAGPYSPAVKRTGYRMIAAIIPLNGQLSFVKAVGPRKTMSAHADSIRAFVRSCQKDGK